MEQLQEYIPAYLDRVQYSFTLVFSMIVTLYVAVFILFKNQLALRRIQLDKPPPAKLIRHDLIWTSINLVFTSITPIVVLILVDQELLIALDKRPTSFWIIGAEFLLFFFLFDAFYYHAHRLLHQKTLYRWIHQYHHRATSPNFFTAFAFHPLEGVFMSMMSSIVAYGLGFHFYSLVSVMLFQYLMNMSVHCGHEYFPKFWYQKWFTAWFMSPTFHDQHHEKFNYNFGAFTTIWDRVFKTVSPTLIADFDLIKQRRKKAISVDLDDAA